MSVELWVGENPVLEERLSPLEEAAEAKRLLAAFIDTFASKKRIPRAWRVYVGELPGHKSLRVYNQSPRGEKSLIIESGIGERGEIRFIEADKRKGPKVYAHTQTAARKAREFLDEFHRALRAS